MNDFEDPELGRLLGRAGGAFPDVNVAYERLQGRVRRARRRRAAVVGSATCGLLLAVGAVVANRATDTTPLQPSYDGTLNGSLPDDTIDDSSPDNTSDTTNNTTDNTTGNSVDTTTDNSSNPSTPTTVSSSPTTTTFTGQGGSVTVRLQNNSLTLVSYSATSGFSVEVHDSGGDRVEVRFESSSHETRIRVDVENGAMDPSIDENDN
jgi:hypothetical protein